MKKYVLCNMDILLHAALHGMKTGNQKCVASIKLATPCASHPDFNRRLRNFTSSTAVSIYSLRVADYHRRFRLSLTLAHVCAYPAYTLGAADTTLYFKGGNIARTFVCVLTKVRAHVRKYPTFTIAVFDIFEYRLCQLHIKHKLAPEAKFREIQNSAMAYWAMASHLCLSFEGLQHVRRLKR